MNMTKLFALLTALVLAASLLTGCGAKAPAPAPAEAPAAAEAPVEETPAEEPAAEEPAAEEGVMHIALTVTTADGHSDLYNIDTTAEFLKEAIEDVVELGGSEGDYGFYIESVNGEVADYNTDGAYWAIYVNDEYGMYGVDSQPVTDGDRYALVYTKG